jgi:hypothetical protein
MIFDIAAICAACLLVASPLIFRKALKLRDKFIDWIERKQFERWLDRAGR